MNRHLLTCFFFLLILINLGCEKEETFLSKENDAFNQMDSNYITQLKAKEISNNIIFEEPESKKAIKKTISKVFQIKDENSLNLFYIINYRDNGFLILSADRRSIPILGYSENNFFPANENIIETQESGVLDWITYAKGQIKEIRNKNLSNTKEIEFIWESFENERKISSSNVNALNEPPVGGCQQEMEEVSSLLGSEWGQRCGFNDLLDFSNCTSHACGRVYAGCVPIAIAQLMKFHEFPNNYNWSNMPDNGSIDASILIKDIHNFIPSSKLTYSCNSTAVKSDYDVAGLFKTGFGYSTATEMETNNYAEITKSNLRQGRPVIFVGSNSTTGHMWVCDGFRSIKHCLSDGMSATTLYLHMNWGWYGQHDGWYAWNNFNPNSTYNQNKKVYYNIKP